MIPSEHMVAKALEGQVGCINPTSVRKGDRFAWGCNRGHNLDLYQSHPHAFTDSRQTPRVNTFGVDRVVNPISRWAVGSKAKALGGQ
ncbi:hypothetical protein MUK42_36253 [Musa troglodytarum]|uniref:Uncharacterized protein n=1 Tax=Musa troglodytarum TaxID=320322 RepID=A0A9E7EIK9_9LILI|nr:hypothetical protein MUK42_36253 [Musa troglodytarum]